MKTEVTIKRPFMGGEVLQRSKTEMFSATSLVKIANQKRREIGKPPFNLAQFLKTQSTLSFIEELQRTNFRVIVKGRGRNSNTWVHPLLFIDIALAIDPKFKIEVYQWLYDELLKNRNDSGASYNKMSGSLHARYDNKQQFHKYIVKVAKYIREQCGVKDWNSCSEEKLKLRDSIHENIHLLCSVLNNTNQAVRLGVKQAIIDYNKKPTPN